jgi:predicted CXXCH cytochrome family protein
MIGGAGPRIARSSPVARAAALLLFALALLPARSLAGVAGSPHDMTLIVQDPFHSACSYCHVAHGARGDRLWAQSTSSFASGWGTRPIAILCYTCHQSGGAGFNASNMSAVAFNDLSHGYDVAKMPLAPDGTAGTPADLPYVGTGLLDCTSCHDPHSSIPPFLRSAGIDQLCKQCHGRENVGLARGVNSFTLPGGGGAAFSLHPTDVPYQDAASNGVTNLREFPPELQVPTASWKWTLGGHRIGWQTGSGDIGCQTCHAVHGWGYYPEGRATGFASGLTAVENSGGASAALCESCHAGGTPGTTVGAGDDHPLDRNDGTPPTVFPAGWPAGAAGEVTCSSCHDAHGGTAGTSLLRQGGSAGGWCWSCHDRASVVPPYHHSTQGNDAPSGFVSIISCEDCHGGSAGWSAHNGFSAMKVPEAPDRSALCEICHVPDNPLAFDPAAYLKATGLTRVFDGAVQPALHGLQPPGKASHLIDAADDDSIANCQNRKTPWPSTGLVSKYGAAGEVICESCHGVMENAGKLLGADASTRLTGGWTANLLLEPYEDNSPGIGVETPDSFPGATLSGLCRGCHHSIVEGVPPSFVHNPAAHTVESYLYPVEFTPYGRQTTRLLTAPKGLEYCLEVTSADASGAPGRMSFPAQDQLDCDSCHRPHGAHDASGDDGKRRILEFTGPQSHGTVPCLECHDTNLQCGGQ